MVHRALSHHRTNEIAQSFSPFWFVFAGRVAPFCTITEEWIVSSSSFEVSLKMIDFNEIFAGGDGYASRFTELLRI